MQYMLLIYSNPALEPAYGTPEFEKMMGGYFTLNERMKADGTLRGGEGLQGIETATSLRLRGGKVETMDGPFAETKEILAGFNLLEAETEEEALRIARSFPWIQFGSIEVREIDLLGGPET